MDLKMALSKSGVIFAIFTLLVAEPPQWFLKPSFDVAQLYGFGVGENPARAKQNAIIDLANSLQASVETSFEKQTKRLETNLASSASQTISIHTRMTDLLNVEATKTQCDKNQCYVQVEIPKAKLLKQLEQRIKEAIKEITKLNSPFSYLYKRDVIYPKILQDYALYVALGGLKLEVPDIGERPTFDLRFEYDGNFSKSFRDILEKTIQDYITQFGKIFPRSNWKILMSISQEDQSVLLHISASHNDEIIHNASVSDTKKSTTSMAFFANRLGAQVYKKIQKWGINPKE